MLHCDTAVRTQYVLPVTSPVSLLTQTSFHHTFCTVHTVHPVCSPLTLVVNIPLTTIVHHIFSSVLAEPQAEDMRRMQAVHRARRVQQVNQIVIRIRELEAAVSRHGEEIARERDANAIAELRTGRSESSIDAVATITSTRVS